MARLQPCAACGRHIRRLDLECPFCGHAEAVTTAPFVRLSSVVLGLALVGCTASEGVKEEAAGAAGIPAAPQQVASPAAPPVVVAPPPVEVPTTAPPIVEPPATGVGVDDGASLDAAVDIAEVRPSTKYGAPPRPQPRPAKKYGAPPKPGASPFDDDGP